MKKIYTIILLLSFNVAAQFDSLSDIITYAKDHEEYPSIDNDDWRHPDYTSFYKQQKKSIFSRLFSYLGFERDVELVSTFEQLLKTVTDERIARNMKGAFVQKITPDPQNKFIIFGDLDGALHSFVRDLQELVRLNLITENLIISDNSYLVFNGNVINSSAYNIETLTVILTLMARNPDRVIYIRGKHEAQRELRNIVLYKQLEFLSPLNSEDVMQTVFSFFDTLPLALYVVQSNRALKISAHMDTYDEKTVSQLLVNNVDSEIMHVQKGQQNASQDVVPIAIEATIVPSDFSRSLGLKRLIGPPLTWTVLSSPTGAHRRLDSFFNDAFAVVETALRFDSWTIALYFNDLRKNKGFQVSGLYNISTGMLVSGDAINFFDDEQIKDLQKKLNEQKDVLKKMEDECKEGGKEQKKEKTAAKNDDIAVQDGVLVLGSTLDLSKGFKDAGNNYKSSLVAAFNDVNEEGGVHGLEFRNVILDDHYEPKRARQNMLKLLNDIKTDIIFLPAGTPTLKASLDLIKDGKILALFPTAQSSIFRQPDLKYIINATVSYFEQGKALIDYVFKENKPKKVAVFYQNDDFGKDVLNGAKEAIKKYTTDAMVELPYSRNQVGFSEQKEVIVNEDPDVIIFASVPIAGLSFIKELGTNFLSQRRLLGISDMGEAEVQDFVKSKGLTFTHSSVWPSPRKSDLPLMKEFRTFAKNNNLEVSNSSLEAYVDAQIFFYLLKQIDGPINKENIIKAAENTKNVDFKGFKLNFNPQTRVLENSLWINPGDGSEWISIQVEVPETEDVPDSSVPDDSVPGDSVFSESDKKPSIAVRSDAIVLGNTSDFSKGLKAFAESLKSGIQLKVDQINKEGGIKGKILQMIYLDDEYSPQKALSNVETFIKEIKTDLLLLCLGTPTLNGYLDLIKKQEVLALFPYTGASAYRKPDLTNIIHYRPSYAQAMAEVAKYIAQNYEARRFVLFYQESIGTEPPDAIKKVLKENFDISDVLAISYVENDLDFSSKLQKIKDFNADAFAFIGPPISAQGLIRQIGVTELVGKKLFGLAALEEKSFKRFVKEKGLHFILPNIVPDAQKSDIPLAQEFRQATKNKAVKVDQAVFEAYLYTALTGYLLDQVEGEITKEKIIKMAEGLQNFDFKGILLTFDPQTRTLSNNIWINTDDGTPWKKIELERIEQVSEEEAKKEIGPKEKEKDSVGSREALGVKEDVIVFGSTLDLSKGIKKIGRAVRLGTEARLSRINEQGGVKGKRFQVVFLDDEYTPGLAQKNINTFLHEIKTDLTLNSLGTPTLVAYLNLVKEGKILVLFTPTGTALFRDPELTHIINFRVSYSQEIKATTDYMIKKYNAKKVVLFYQNDDFGLQTKEAARKVLEKNNISDVLEVPYNRNDVMFKKHVKTILEFKPDTIAFISTPIATQELMRQMGVTFLSDKHLYGTSDLSENSFQDFLKEKGITVLIPNTVPDPATSDIPIAQEFRKDAQKNDAPITGFAFEAYINTALIAYIIDQIEGDISIDAIIKAAESIKDVDFKGLKLNFNDNTRELSSQIWISKGDGSPWTEVAVEPEEIEAKVDKQEVAEVTPTDKKVEEKYETEVSESKELPSVVTPEQAEQAAIANKKPLLAVHKDKIIFGSTMDLEKGAKNQGKAIQQSLKIVAEQINQRGGIDGKQLEMLFLNDDYEPIKARANIDMLLNKDQTDLILSSPGTPTLEAYLDLVKNGTLLVLFPLMGSGICRHPQLKNVINFRISYAQEIKAATQYMIDQGAGRFVLFYQDDAFGKDLLKAARIALKKNNVSEVLELPYSRNNLSFNEQVKQIKAYKPDTIAFLSTAVASQGLIRQIGVKGLTGKRIYGNSDLGEVPFQSFIKSKGLKTYVPNVVPDPERSNIEIAQEFREAAKKESMSIDTVGFEAYINAFLAEYLLSKVDGQLTKEKIIKVAESIKDEDFKGLKLNFNPQTRELSYHMWLSKGDGSPWTKVEVKPEEKSDEEDIQVEEPKDMQVEVPKIEESKDIQVEVPKIEKPKDIKKVEMPKDDKPALGVSADKILFGSTLDLSKGVKDLGMAIKGGTNMFFNRLNGQGGIKGRQFQAIFLDDEYVPRLARDNIEKFLSEIKTQLILSPLGTPTLTGYLDLVKEGKVLVFFPTAGIRDPDLTHLIHFRASFAQEVIATTEYMIKEQQVQKLVVFYQNDDFGIPPKDAILNILKENSSVKHLEIPYNRNDVAFLRHVEQIKAFSPDAIALVVTPTAAKELIRILGVAFLSDKKVYSVSTLWEESFQKFLKQKGLHLFLTSVVPDPHTSDIEIVKEFRRDAKKANIPIDTAAFVAYINAALIVYIIENIKGEISVYNIIQTAQNIKNVDFKGLQLNFNDQTRELATQVWLSKGDGSPWIELKLNR
ncbi:MAG: ABC transporter substrate-binding protein [Candidatus Dependentiae bacterium]